MGRKAVTEEFLSLSGQGDIQIIPIAIGSIGDIGEIIGGGLLIAFGGAVPIFGPLLVKYGFDLVIGGITDILTTQNSIPNTSSVSDIDPLIRGSYSFSGIQNVSSSGVPIPIIYGYVFSGSILISAGVDTVQLISVVSDIGTYSQDGFVITFNLNNHGFKNGEVINIEFTSGPIFDIGGIFNFNPLALIVENKTTNTFESNFAGTGKNKPPTSVKEHMTYDNSANNVFKPLNRVIS